MKISLPLVVLTVTAFASASLIFETHAYGGSAGDGKQTLRGIAKLQRFTKMEIGVRSHAVAGKPDPVAVLDGISGQSPDSLPDTHRTKTFEAYCQAVGACPNPPSIHGCSLYLIGKSETIRRGSFDSVYESRNLEYSEIDFKSVHTRIKSERSFVVKEAEIIMSRS